MTIYDVRRWGTALFMLLVVVVVGAFLWFSNSLVEDLAEQERARMQIWANATREMATITSGETDIPLESSFFDFLLNIIEENRNIPVLLTDDGGNIITHRNFELPEPIDSGNPMYISPVNMAFLQGKLEGLRESQNVIHITISPGLNQHLYYEDSKLLRSLNFYPYVQVVVMVMFVLVVYFAVSSTKKAEQNKVWVGLSKETAHQLGTPISSLMAWTQLMPDFGVPQDVVGEMDKDVKRLETIASRFSKIGSVPALEPENLNEVVRRSVTYMATRISSQIALTADYDPQDLPVSLSAPLFEWVMENLIKNAVDAMAGNGSIHVVTSRDNNHAIVEVTDTGKGIPRKNFKTVFRPGYTTKKRGWGLGLALAKRIIEQYHRGSIIVASSTPGEGTTFRITLPLA
ncbi:MAG: HAMP domain-containing histidine kinase [Muribaculaceae bacterium]|nr:HAMP domain-containing histidine kinase [Muribaculaceae bacterium]